MKSIFEYSAYPEYLRDYIKNNKHIRGIQILLAQAIGCQRSVISQVLNRRADFTLDQAGQLCSYLKLSDDESGYFLDLVSLERAVSPKLRALLKDRIDSAKRKREDLSIRFAVGEALQVEQQVMYYSAWYWSAIHVLVSVPGFGTNEAISQRLGLPKSLVTEVLIQLLKMNLIDQVDGVFRVRTHQMHLPNSSPMNLMNHLNWRHKAIERIPLRNSKEIHYTSVFAASKSDIEEIRRQMLKLIDSTREIIKLSPEEELVCLNCDLFKV